MSSVNDSMIHGLLSLITHGELISQALRPIYYRNNKAMKELLEHVLVLYC
jgi:hypothetical protein